MAVLYLGESVPPTTSSTTVAHHRERLMEYDPLVAGTLMPLHIIHMLLHLRQSSSIVKRISCLQRMFNS
jgi:hypothetical protein